MARLRGLLNGSWLASAWRALLDWVYPPHCVHCGEPVAEEGGHVLCSECRSELAGLRVLEPRCRRCGMPFPSSAKGDQCGVCSKGAQTFHVARSIFNYEEPVTSVVQEFKYRGGYYLADAVVENLVEKDWLPEDIRDIDCMVPIPLHPRRRRERGYDQALMVAEAFSRQWGWPLVTGAVRRTRYTEQQVGKGPRHRWINVDGAFDAEPGPVEERHVLLADDVMTTGATASACASALYRAGAKKVSVLTLARAVP